MKLKQITVPIENSPDRLYAFTKALGDSGINLRALNLVDTEHFGELRILVSDVVAARRILMRHQIPARVEEVVAVEIADRPGEFSRLLEILGSADITIRYTYAFAGMTSGKAIMIFRFSDNDRAVAVLTERGVTPIDAEAFGLLENVSPMAECSVS